MIYRIIIFHIIGLSAAHVDNIFIVDYFKHKLVPHVAGFSCNDRKENTELMKNFSNFNVYSTIDGWPESNNVTLKTYLSSFHRKLGVFFDTRCKNDDDNHNLFKEAGSYLLYGETHHWLVFSDDIDKTIEILDDSEFTISTDFVIAASTDEKKFVIYDVFNLCKYRGGVLNVTLLGSWNNEDGLDITLTRSKFTRRANFNGMILRMPVLVLDKPEETPLRDYLHDYATKQNDTMPKFTLSIWEAIAELFNFTIEFMQMEKTKAANRNGPIIKLLSDRKAELAGNTAILTPERVDVVNPCPLWPLRTCFMFRTTQSKKIKVNHFLRPLANATWILTIVSVVLVVFVFASVLVVECGDKYQRLSDSILFAIGSLCQQGTDLQATKAPTRIALLQTMIFSLLLYNYYSASVVSARLSEPLEKINDSLNELAKTNLKFGAEPILYFNFYIKRSDWEGQQFYNRRWIKIPDEEKFLPPIEGVRKILDGGFAYHIDVNVAFPKIEKLFDNQHVCQLTFVHLVPPTDTCLMTARNGSFVEMTRVGVAKIREIGLRARLVHKWAARTPRCRTDIIVIDPLSIYEVAPAFLLLIIGISAGLTLCSFEMTICCDKYHNNALWRYIRLTGKKLWTFKFNARDYDARDDGNKNVID